MSADLECIEIRVVWPRDRNLDYPAEDQLKPFVPPGATQVNYGQGEGQIRIGESIWGVYWDSGDVCRIQFEEGELSLAAFTAALESIGAALETYFGFPIQFQLVGALNRRERHELYL